MTELPKIEEQHHKQQQQQQQQQQQKTKNSLVYQNPKCAKVKFNRS